ncbi:hypothetical protein RCH07_000901 [Arthrobacter sp. CG_A4]|nr:hypothetical protein [Arthrobacter sp. CG_A4]
MKRKLAGLVELGWTRVVGSEACGGPATAGPVRLVISADR